MRLIRLFRVDNIKIIVRCRRYNFIKGEKRLIRLFRVYNSKIKLICRCDFMSIIIWILWFNV